MIERSVTVIEGSCDTIPDQASKLVPPGIGRLAFRHETMILGRVVVIRTTTFGRYEVSMQGRNGFEKDPRIFAELGEAQVEAHLFVHRTLHRICTCDRIRWTAVQDLIAAGAT